MISISPNSHLRSSAKHVIWRNFIFADTGIEKFCVQFDGCHAVSALRGAVRGSSKHWKGAQPTKMAMAMSPCSRDPRRAANQPMTIPAIRAGVEDQSTNHEYKRGPTLGSP